MKRFSLLLIMVLLLATAAAGEEGSRRFVEEYSGSNPRRETSASPSHAWNRVRAYLVLEEEYGAAEETGPARPEEQRSGPSWYQILNIQEDHPLYYALSLLLLFVLILLVTDLYLRFRMKILIARIPWEWVQTDPRIVQWPSAILSRKLYLWRYFRDLTQVEAILALRDSDAPLQRKQAHHHHLSRKYVDYLKHARGPGEARFTLAVLSVIGTARAVAPCLNVLKEYPENPELADDVAHTLLSIQDGRILTTLIPFLSSAEPLVFEIMVHVCKSFGRSGAHLVAKELERHKTAPTHVGIIRLLGELEEESSIPAIEPYLLQGTEKERIAAAEALARIGTLQTVQPLIDGLCHNPSSSVRKTIADGLKETAPDLALEQLTRIVETSPTHYFRIRAIEGLEALQAESSTVLHGAVKDDHPKVRSAAAAALERLGVVQSRLNRYLQDYNLEDQKFLIHAGRAGVLDSLITALNSTESKTLKRAVRLAALIGNHEIIPHLMELLETTEDWTVQSRLIPALAQLKAAEALTLIIKHLDSKYHWVRKTAVDAIGKLLSPDSSLRNETLPVLRQALADENPWTRASAIRVLTLLEDRSSVPAFIELLEDSQTRVRVDAIRGLKQFQAVEAQAALLPLLDDPRQKVCAMAASALGQFKSRKALIKLFEKFENSKPLLRLAILEAVHHIDPMEVDPMLRDLRTADRNNLKVIRQLKDVITFNPTESLLTLARQGETEIRCQAIRSLSSQESPEVEGLLVSMLENPEPEIRAATVDAIALTQNAKMADTLNEMRNDPDLDVRLRVILALGLIKNPETLPYLRNSLYHSELRIRAHAIMTLFHYAESHFLEFFLDQFKQVKVRNLLKKMLSDRKDPVIAALVERIPASKEEEFQILKNHSLRSLDIYLEAQILTAKTREEKLRAIMMAEILKRKQLKTALRKALQEDPSAQIRARALRAYAEITEISKEKDLIQQAIQDPALEVQTMASRLLIHLEENPV